MKKAKDGGGGNVTEIDLGEKVSESIRQEVADQVRMAGGEKRGNVTQPRPVSRLSRFSGGYRPGMYGGYRPSWADRSSLSGGGWKLGEFLKLPEQIKSAGKDLLVGGLVGTVANRVVAWVAPGLVKTDSKLATEAIGFAVGIVPYLVKQNVTTLGVALPGFFFLAGSLAEYAIGKTNLLGAKPALSGPAQMSQQAADPVIAARQKIAEVQNRIAQARKQAFSGVPRIQAQRVA
jgi:hypothetical protein